MSFTRTSHKLQFGLWSKVSGRQFSLPEVTKDDPNSNQYLSLVLFEVTLLFSTGPLYGWDVFLNIITGPIEAYFNKRDVERYTASSV